MPPNVTPRLTYLRDVTLPRPYEVGPLKAGNSWTRYVYASNTMCVLIIITNNQHDVISQMEAGPMQRLLGCPMSSREGKVTCSSLVLWSSIIPH